MYLTREAWLAKVGSWEGGLLLVIMATARGALVLEIRTRMLQRATGASQAPTGSWQPG